MNVYTARPQHATGGGIMVFQEAFGVNEYIRDICERFAALGMTAMAPELFHRTGPGFEAGYDDFEPVRKHMSALTTEGISEDVRETYDRLTQEPGVDKERIAAIGFCLGGRVAYIANAVTPLRAAVSYYGGGIAPDLLGMASQQHGPILMFWGGKDQHIPREQYRSVADALTAAGKTHEQVIFSQADHGFFCDRRGSYEAHASRQAWALTQEFLRTFGALS
jgi:carboxymethylenebutenolidase